jgi:hypothetical protein
MSKRVLFAVAPWMLSLLAAAQPGAADQTVTVTA